VNYSESKYINAGYMFEKNKLAAESIRRMIESERVEDRAEARRLIEVGRREARQ